MRRMQPQEAPVERRQTPRVPIVFPVAVSIGKQKFQGASFNISLDGMTLDVPTEGQHHPGAALELAFQLPGTTTAIQTRATIMWSDYSRVGVRFVQLCPDHERAIAEWIKGHAPKPS